MTKNRLLAGALVAIAIASGLYYVGSMKDTEQAKTIESRTHKKWLQYQYEIQNTTNHVLSDVRLSSFAPVANSPFHKTVSLAATYPYETEMDDHGNRLLHFRFDSLAPYETRIVAITVEVGFALSPAQIDEPVMHQAYVDGEAGIEITDSGLITQANMLKQENSLKTARAIFDWVRSHLSYSGYNADDKGALYAFENKTGDCTEYAYLFAALSRINGIPTRVMAGFVQNGKVKVSADEYHNWVEIQIDGAWLVVDPEKGMFVEDPSDYVAMRVISASAISISANSHGMAAASQGAQIRMM